VIGQGAALGSFSQQFSNEVHARITKHMRQMGIVIENKAKELVPKRTGRLHDSITYSLDENNYTLSIVVGAPYGVFVEYGTRHMMPHPYIRPALNQLKDIYGINTEMAFLNTPHIHAPIIASGKDFFVPSTLTPKQVQHVKQHLKPTSESYHIRNVRRSKLVVRHP
jgi:HK97 gp10 family phage protein